MVYVRGLGFAEEGSQPAEAGGASMPDHYSFFEEEESKLAFVYRGGCRNLGGWIGVELVELSAYVFLRKSVRSSPSLSGK
jgi:hypothetical protein